MLCSCSCIHRAPAARVTATEVSPDSPPRPPGVVSGFAPRCSVVPTEWPAGPRHISPPQKSHVIRLHELSTKPRNVAIPTMPIQCLKGLHGNYVRNCWAHTKQSGSRKAAGPWGRDYDSTASRTSPTWPASSTTPHQRPIPAPSPPHRVAGQPASPARVHPRLRFQPQFAQTVDHLAQNTPCPFPPKWTAL